MMRFFALGVVGAISLCVLAGPTSADDDLPEIRSKAAAVIDAESGAEIFGKAADEIRPIASTTKIFVAMVVRKKGIDLDGWTKITRTDVREALGGSRTRLDVGEQFKNRDLLRAMLISSDNRAPTALGRAVGLDPDEMVSAMNKLAKELGLKKTKFTDPSGLHGNVSTAREMGLALRAALEDKVLREIMGTETYTVRSKDRSASIDYITTNLPLQSKKYDVIGGKTGYTTSAGYCFITGAKFDKRELVMVFLGAPEKLSRFGDFNRVAEWIERGGAAALARVKSSVKRPSKAEAQDRVATPEETE
jgi:D-alanyl-D-alanine endopeptidase (penicillin-binding protein 7)